MVSREPVYVLQQPDSLESLARKAFTSWIISKAKWLLTWDLHLIDSYYASALIDLHTSTIRHHLLGRLPGPINSELTNETKIAMQEFWKDSSSKKDYTLDVEPDSRTNVIGRMIESVYTENLTYLSVKFLTNSQYTKMFLATLGLQGSLIHKLSHLCINTLTPMEDVEIMRIIRQLPNLKKLSLKNCTHNVVRCIADNCRLIENLELWHQWYNKRFSIKSVEILAQLPNLKTISLIQTSLDATGMKRLFLSVDVDVKILVTMSAHNKKLECTVERCLELIIRSENFRKVIGLTYYEDSSRTKLVQLQLVVAMCPLIKKVSLQKPKSSEHKTAEEYLLTINCLPGLIELELTNFDFYTDKLYKLLQIKGSALSHLHLRSIQQMDLNALFSVYESCPNLESLYINNCCFVEDTTLYERPSFEPCELQALKKLTLVQTDKLPKDLRMNLDELAYILMSIPNVEYIHTVGIPLEDYVMEYIFQTNEMKYLKQWKLFKKDQWNVETDWVAQVCNKWVNHPEVVFSHFYSENELLLINRSILDN